MGCLVEDNEIRKIFYRALAPSVLFVAVLEKRFDYWRCFCKGVKGVSHNKEYKKVFERGSSIPEEIANAIFPELKSVNYRI